MSELLITGARLIDGRRAEAGSLRVSGETIAEVYPAATSEEELTRIAARHGAERIDGTGHWLLPGGVDPHVHFALPVGGTITADDFVTGGRAALAGGTTTVIDFVTPARGESLLAAAEARIAQAEACPCDISLHLSVTEWTAATAVEMRRGVEELGLRSLKLYLAYLETIGLDDADLRRAMETAAELDIPVLMHCEEGVEVARLQRRLLAAGERTPAAHPRSRPPEVEERAVHRALDLAHDTGCRAYIVHLSTAGGLDAVATARDRGQTVYVETCPQYLFLDERVYTGPFERSAPFVMSPPLRPSRHSRALAEAVVAGTVDVIATDHCSFTRAQKARGRDDFTAIPGGAAGVEHRLALTFSLLHDLPTLAVDLLAANPARIFGLADRKGSLTPGTDADLVLWDPDVERTLHVADDHGACDHSIWEDAAVRGAVKRVWSRGDPVVDRERIDAPEGRARRLRR